MQDTINDMTPAEAGLNERLLTLEMELREARTQIEKTRRRVQTTWAVAVIVSVGSLSLGQSAPALAQGFGAALKALADRITALETKTAAIAAVTDANTGKPTLRITGVNVQIVNGTGKTDGNTGTGNLIIGYNELRNDANSPDVRTGSHNLVTGVFNNYSGSGGAVMGLINEISGSQASVLGGYGNKASGDRSTVCGGQGGTASGAFASVLGGLSNIASGPYATVSGGQLNVASETNSSVSGGQLNVAAGTNSSVSGGVSVNKGNAYGQWAAGGFFYPNGGSGAFHNP